MDRLEQAIRDLQLPVVIARDVDEADVGRLADIARQLVTLALDPQVVLDDERHDHRPADVVEHVERAHRGPSLGLRGAVHDPTEQGRERP